MLIQKGRTCTRRGGKPSHPSSTISLVNCRKCHAAKCFFHILQASIHASEALLASAADSGSAVWHKRHQEARERGILPLANLPLVHDLDELDRRVFFARHFSSTSPLEPSMRVGFYDAPLQDTPLVSSSCQHAWGHFYLRERQPPADAASDHELAASIDIPPALRPSASMSLSRTSSRSTITLTTDTEAPIAASQQTQRTREQDPGLDPGPSVRMSKRPRRPEKGGNSDDDDDDDDEYQPRKRARLNQSSTRNAV